MRLLRFLWKLFFVMMTSMEDNETKELLEKELEIAQENNKILKKIQRGMRLGSFFSILYWLFILGTAVGAYYFLQPFVESFGGILGFFSNGIDGIQGLDKIPEVDALLKTININR